MNTKVFSLETQKNKIYDRRTRKYFDEVYKSYANGCYRSATVMLWSVVVCDLIYKLQELRDLYGDNNAEKILIETEKARQEDPYSSKWEKELVRKIFERTQLLDTASNHKISLIQNHRHLSAHPVISNEDILFEPTEEMIRSDIRNAIECILEKPSFLTQKILDTIVVDLENIKNLFPEDKSLSKYLESKYFGSLNRETTVKIFRGLWKFVFRSEDEKPVENREINLRAMKLIFDRERNYIIDAIKSDSKYYSHISSNSDVIKSLIEFISLEKDIFSALEDSAKELIKPIILENISYFGIAFFISDSPSVHIAKTTMRINEKYFKKYGDGGNFFTEKHISNFKAVCKEFGLEDDYRSFGIACFINSADFERADIYYDRYIEPNLIHFSIDQFNSLLSGTNKNNQCYWRNRSRIGDDSIKMLRAARVKLGLGYDFSQYENLPHDKIDENDEKVGAEV
jgi:hypothetical protein